MLDCNALPYLFAFHFICHELNYGQKFFVKYTKHQKIDVVISLHLDFYQAYIDQVTLYFCK